jgi:pSer/pThr/pTyr-binding forkhead associated (FHA) protein
MAGHKIPLTFKIFKGDQLIREETLSQPVIKVGKLSTSHLRLDDDSVSRMHAVIEVTGPGDVSIIDLGSTAGTHVNGQKVNKAKLQSGDTVVLGDLRIEVSIGGAADEEEDDAPTKVQMSPATDAEPAGGAGVISSTPRPPAAAPPPPAAAPPPPAAAPPPPPGMAAAPPPPGMAAAPPPPGMAGFAGAALQPPPGMPGAPVGAAPAPQFGMDQIDDLGGARAVEIASMLGDSVVNVKHVSNPRGGKITAVTYALFAGGTALLLMSAVAFVVGVNNTKFNVEARQAWIDSKRPVYDFRPRRISLAYDWMAFGGLLGGLTSLTMGLIRYRNELVSPFFRIGRAAGVDHPLDGAPLEDFPLVAPLGDDFVFNYGPSMEGEMMVDGQSVTLAELQQQGRSRPSSTAAGALETPIPPQARFRVRLGQSTFMVSSVPQPRRQAAPVLAAIESRPLAYLAGSAIFFLGLWGLLRAIPPDPHALALDLSGADGRITRVESLAQEDPLQEEDELEEDADDESGGTGTAMALDEGKMGKEDSQRDVGRYAMKDEGADPQLAREQAMDQAREAGFLAAFNAQQGGAFASLTGTGDFSSGLDDVNVYGGLLGDEVGEMQGGFGFGRSGFGPGGGGTGWGTIGTGRYGTIGHGSGTGSGYGAGAGRGGMRGRTAQTPQVRIGNATATGDLDRNIIRRYIRRKLPQIKYCYEKQLLVRPGLDGTVVSEFTISPQGAVLNSKASGVAKEVSDCVADVIGTIQFPAPKGGGLVQVRYPFTFRPSGG